MTNAMSIRHLSLSFTANKKVFYVVDDINIDVKQGEVTALVGESGCGKTMTALCCMGLQPRQVIATGSIVLCGEEELLELSEKQWCSVRGNRISMIFQDPLAALNPCIRVGHQIEEAGCVHGMEKKQACRRARELMEMTGLEDIEHLSKCFPHQLSGGQRQRIMIATALMNTPEVVIADEPTSSLDATIQSQIVEMLTAVVKRTGTALLLITHDLHLVKSICETVYIMYCGRIVETGSACDIFNHPLHPYTNALLASIPNISIGKKRLSAIAGYVPPVKNRSFHCCPFYDRCIARSATAGCNNKGAPPTCRISASHFVSCHLMK